MRRRFAIRWRNAIPTPREFGSWLVARGRRIGSYFAATDVAPRQRIETLMREYGAAGVVDNEPIAAGRAPL